MAEDLEHGARERVEEDMIKLKLPSCTDKRTFLKR